MSTRSAILTMATRGPRVPVYWCFVLLRKSILGAILLTVPVVFQYTPCTSHTAPFSKWRCAPTGVIGPSCKRCFLSTYSQCLHTEVLFADATSSMLVRVLLAAQYLVYCILFTDVTTCILLGMLAVYSAQYTVFLSQTLRPYPAQYIGSVS